MRIRGKDMHIHFVINSGNGWTQSIINEHVLVSFSFFSIFSPDKAKLNSAMKGKALAAAAALVLALLALGEGGSTSSKLQSMEQMNGTYGLVTGL